MLSKELQLQLQKNELILDFDGTITKLNINWKKLKTALANKLKSKDIHDMSTLYLYAQSINKKNKYIRTVSEAEINGININLKSDLFRFIQENRIPINIVSNNSKATVIKFMKENKYLDLCKNLICMEDVNFLKPNPQGLNMLLKKNSSTKQYFFIGNSINDYIASKQAKIKYLNYDFQ